MSFHFMRAQANVPTRPALDRVSKISEFKVCFLRMEESYTSGSLDRWRELENSSE